MINNIPKLRFPEFDDEWQFKKIGDISNVITGNTPITSDRSLYGNEYDFISPGDMNSGRYITNSKQKLSEKGFKKSRQITIGSTLFVCIGSTIGKIAQIKKTSATNQQINAIIANDDYDKDFLYLNLLKAATKIAMLAGEQAVPIINKNDFSKNKLYFPDKAEQRKIADFLTVTDEKIISIEKKVELLKKYKKCVMQKIFTHQIRFKDIHDNLYHDWKYSDLNNIVNINPKVDSLPDSFVYIDLESVSQGKLLQEKKINKVSAPSRAQRLLNKKDILFQTVRPYQRNNYFFNLEGDYVASTGYAQIRSEVPEFIYQLLHTDSFVNSVLGYCTGTNYPAINSSDLGRVIVEVPSSLEEQHKIADFLTTLDDKISITEKELEQAKQFKKILLQRMFA